MQYPQNKQFALTIIDDTDGAQIDNVRPVYEFLEKLGIRTTKTIWIFPSRDKFKGLSIKSYRYRQYINKLQHQGFEIALHSVGSGKFTRQDIIDGLEIFKQFNGVYPKIQINHAQNPDNLYWGLKRFHLFRLFWRFAKYHGEDPDSAYFWGDLAQKNIKYVRNFAFRGLNTLKIDPQIPYHDDRKPYVNFWFSSADGGSLEKINNLLAPKNIDRLKKEGGAAIIYTHFGEGFTKNGVLDRTFRQRLVYLAKQDGYFVPASVLLDWIAKNKKAHEGKKKNIRFELKWFWDKILDKLF